MTNELFFESIRFINGDYKKIKKEFYKKSCYMVVPAAPALKKIYCDKIYYKSLKESSFAIFDSGYFCLLLRILKNIKVKKFSGLKFLREFFNDNDIKKESIFLINPSHHEAILNKNYLNKLGIKKLSQYTAPNYKYKNIIDKKLLSIIRIKKPRFIIVNLGGGKQEILANYLHNNLKHKYSIFCTGAAIAFLTGHQASIPDWFDKAYLGWFFRILFRPSVYFSRYIISFSLINTVIKSKITMKG